MSEHAIRLNLDDPDIMALSEAAEIWKKDDSYMRRTFDQFLPGTIRKFGKVWVVTREGMEARYGPEPKEKARL